MKIAEIYKEYQVPKNLQEHMFRVASVAKIVLSKIEQDIDSDSIIQACLVHDLGNIVKFTLDNEDIIRNPEDVLFLKELQKKFIDRYGEDDHVATKKILDEIGVVERVKDLALVLGSKGEGLQVVAQGKNLEAKIFIYCDARVSPYDIVSVEERLRDLKSRYIQTDRPHRLSEEEFQFMEQYVLDITGQIEDLLGDYVQDIRNLNNSDSDTVLAEYNIDTKDD